MVLFLLRQTICRSPFLYCRMLGWIALNVVPSFKSVDFVQVLPQSFVYSKWAFHPFFSVLEGHTSVPLISKGLFLMGPRKPGGNASRGLQLLPLSFERIIQPVQPATLGPIL